MRNLAAVEPGSSGQEGLMQARVKMLEDGDCWVMAGHELVRARRAAACLLAPEPGDLVLVHAGDQGAFVLSVLLRATDGPVVLDAPQGMRLRAPTIDLDAAGRLSAASPRLWAGLGRADVAVRELAAAGESVAAVCDAGRFKLGALSRLADRLWSRAKESFRFVEGLDHAAAGRLRRLARETLSLSGKRARIQAEKSVDVNADQIRLG